MESKYLDKEDFKRLFITWCRVGKPKGNNEIYRQIWEGVINAVKADIGTMQKRYNMTVSHYEEKVMDSAIKVVTKLDALPENDAPKSIIALAWLYTYGVVFGIKAIQEDFEDVFESLDNTSEGGDSFIDIIDVDNY